MRRLLWVVMAVFAMAGLAARAAEPPPSEQPAARTLQQADHLYDSGKFADAALAYQRLLEQHKVSASERDDREYRYSVALGKAGEWDRALQASLDFVKRHQRTIWEPRGLHWLGRLYLYLPHTGISENGRVHRSGPSITYGWRDRRIEEQDEKHGRQAMEAAALLFPRYEHGGQRAAAVAEEIQLDFDLARELPESEQFDVWARGRSWAAPSDPVWRVDPSAPYRLEWPTVKKVRYLFARIQMLSTRPGATLGRALALLGEAIWLGGYRELMGKLARRWDGKEYASSPFPYEDRLPETLLRQVIVEAPTDPSALQARLILADVLSQSERYAETIAILEPLLARSPGDPWRADAEVQIRSVRHQELRVTVPSALLPSEPKKLWISARNLSSLRVEVFRFHLLDAMTATQVASNTWQNDFESWFGGPAESRKWYGERVAGWDVRIPESTDFRRHEREATIPDQDLGAYVVEVSGVALQSRSLLLVTDLALVQRKDREGWLQYVADRRTGEPAAGVQLLTQQFWNDGQTERRSSAGGTSSEDGTHEVRAASGGRAVTVRALAWQGNRYALAAPRSREFYGNDDGTASGYCVTDRAAYRPGQTVHCREIAFRNDGDGKKPASGELIHLEVVDPTGQRVPLAPQRTDASGSASFEVTLPSDARLGTYELAPLLVGADRAPEGERLEAGRFRVEEYRTPEFEVTLEAPHTHVRPGQPATVRLSAHYYSGEAVSHGKVMFRVYRDESWSSLQFPPSPDLPHRRSYYSRALSGPVAAAGEAWTDVQGRATLSFATRPEAAATSGRDDSNWSYTVLASVEDTGRRVVSGSGVVFVSIRDLQLLARPQRGYFGERQPVTLEVFAADGAGDATRASGIGKIFREAPPGFERHRKTRLLPTEESAFTVSDDGTGAWTAPGLPGGYYRAELSVQAANGKPVLARTWFWVQGREARQWGTALSDREVELHVQQVRYHVGATATVLLAAPEPGCTVLLLRHDGDGILSHRLLHLKAATTELKFPLTGRDEPNTFVDATIVRNGSVEGASASIFVPCVEKLTRVTLHPDRSRYQPGDLATVRVETRDEAGRPLSSRVCLTAADAALDNIERRESPHIWSRFYGDERQDHVESFGRISDEELDTAYVTPAARASSDGESWRYFPTGMGQIGDFPGDPLDHNAYRRIDWRYVTRVLNEEGMLTYSGKGPDGWSAPVVGTSIRRDFADTAFWSPGIQTDANGTAEVRFRWPDNLTRWRLLAVAVASHGEVGEGETEVTTAKNLMLRLHTPRFLVEGDRTTITATVRNDLSTSQRVRVAFRVGPVPFGTKATDRWVIVPSGGEQHIETEIIAGAPGTMRVTAAARGERASDGEERSIPVLIHGAEQVETLAGVLREQPEARLRLKVPPAIRPGSGELVVQLQPSLVGVLLDALPYLADYPYGCVEQTMSRFLPAVLLRKTLQDAGWNLRDLEQRARQLRSQEERDRAERPGGTIAQSPYTTPVGRPSVSHLPEGVRSPVFDAARLQEMVRAGIERLFFLQHPDGGWGWWSEGPSDWYMSAYVLSGLLTAREAGVALRPEALERARTYLEKTLTESHELSRKTWLATSLASDPATRGSVRALLAGDLFEGRDQLDPQNQARLALALTRLGDPTRARSVLRTLEQTARTDQENGTAHWEISALERSRWYGDPAETNAAVIEAYLAAEPENPIVPQLVRWLADYRRGTIWRSTRETAAAVTALARYAVGMRELSPDCTISVRIGSSTLRTYPINRENALLTAPRIVVPDRELSSGEVPVVITRSGPGTVYYTASLRAFSQAADLPAYGRELRISRRCFRLQPLPHALPPWDLLGKEPNPFLTRHYELLGPDGLGGNDPRAAVADAYRRAPLSPRDPVRSGELLEVELELEAKNEYDYLLFEDPRAAGCEPVDPHSGDVGTGGIDSRREIRDRKVAFFVTHLPAGRTVLRYRVRAEAPGAYDVLPTAGYAMYAPEIAAGSEDYRSQVH